MTKTLDSYEIDINKAINIAKNFKLATNLEVTIISDGSDVMFSTMEKGVGCDFCQKLRQIIMTEHDCERVMLYGSYQAERFGGKYVFFCPRGFTHFSSPIVIDGVMCAAFVAGPTVMVDINAEFYCDLINRYSLGKTDIKELESLLHTIPTNSPEQVEGMSEMLKICAFYAGNNTHDKIIQYDEVLTQQSSISSYIQEIKLAGDYEKYPIEKERELLEAIKTANKPLAQRLLNEILGHIMFSSGAEFKIIKARVLELIILLSRAAMEGGASVTEIYGLNYRYIYEINQYSTVEDLTYWLSRIMVRFTDCVFNLVDVKHVDVIYKAVDYIKNNYMNKITLEDVSAKVFLSSAYFSKVFKDEMGCNFNTYLNRVRVDKAKQFLLKDNVNLVDVSNMVGYEDQSYFSKVFKKVTGITPGKYREARGQVRK